jgi:hypothetical protein
LSSFRQQAGLPFAQVLSSERIEQVFAEEGAFFGQGAETISTPSLTLWAVLSQVLFAGVHRSCAAAVARVVVLCVALGLQPPSEDTGASCCARAKVPERVLRRLAEELADGCERELPQRWLWKGRHVHLMDGTTVSRPDTPQNQAAYPQSTSQQPSLGFPLARMVVLLGLATGMLEGMALGPSAGKETGETALLRQLRERLPPGDVVLADRYYCSYYMIALLQSWGLDVVFRQHACRRSDFRRGRRLGGDDHIVPWRRPDQPEWMDDTTYAQLPRELEVRDLRVFVGEPGFRVRAFVVVTTLTAAEMASRVDIARLYRKRWLVELDLRSLQVTLGLDVLRCKTRERVRQEIWSGFLAYNLIRRALLPAADSAHLAPRELSFTAALQQIAAGWLAGSTWDARAQAAWAPVQIPNLAKQRVGHRPDRVEPRGVKRRPKKQPLLRQPRPEARAALKGGLRQGLPLCLRARLRETFTTLDLNSRNLSP